LGEVDHQLLTTVLEHYHIPTAAIEVIQSLHDNYTISVGTESFITNPILVGIKEFFRVIAFLPFYLICALIPLSNT
jgi:hypothetical protein